jgi:hypothetical protein
MSYAGVVVGQIVGAVCANFFALLVVVAVVLVVSAVVRAVIKVKTSTTATKMAQLNIDEKKLEMVSRRMYLEDLKNASLVLTDEERSLLDSIRADNAVLSRKVLAKMNEIDERTRRVELGADIMKLSRTLDKIKRYERSLFKNLGR